MTVAEQAEGLVEPNGWEPASFVLRCPHGHTWGSYGRYHAQTYTCAPHQPTCPRRGCGQPRQSVEVYTGPNRPGVVEAAA